MGQQKGMLSPEPKEERERNGNEKEPTMRRDEDRTRWMTRTMKTSVVYDGRFEVNQIHLSISQSRDEPRAFDRERDEDERDASLSSSRPLGSQVEVYLKKLR